MLEFEGRTEFKYSYFLLSQKLSHFTLTLNKLETFLFQNVLQTLFIFLNFFNKNIFKLWNLLFFKRKKSLKLFSSSIKKKLEFLSKMKKNKNK